MGKQVVVTRGIRITGFLCLLSLSALVLGGVLIATLVGQSRIHARYGSIGPMAGLSAAEQEQKLLAATSQDGGNGALLQTFDLPVHQELEPPIYVYYTLEGFYSNHKRFARSISWEQLAGIPDPDLSPCEPARQARTLTEQPTLIGSGATVGKGREVTSTGSWVKQEQNFVGRPSTAASDDPGWRAGGQACTDEPLDLDEEAVGRRSGLAAQLFASQIPATNYNTDPDTRGGGTFEGTVSDVPRFVAWARVTASPSVSKPYALLHKKIPAGCAVRVQVQNRFNTYAFDGQKGIILSTRSWWSSSRSLALPIIFFVLGGMLFAAALTLTILGVFT